MKRGPLSKVEKSYIENNPELSIAQIAKDLERTEAQVKKHAGRTEKKVEPQPEKTPETKTQQLMGTHMRNGVPVATVMTAEASMHADTTRSNRVNLGRKAEGALHRPKG